MIKYKIVEVSEQEHSIVVRYYTDMITEQSLVVQSLEDGTIQRCRTDYNLLLPIPTPAGEALESFIMAHAPVGWFTAMEAVQTPAVNTSLAGLTALLGMEQVVGNAATIFPSTLAQKKAEMDARIDRRRAEIMAAGVPYMGHQFQSDPTSVALLTSTVAGFAAGVALPAGMAWRSTINNNVPMNGAQLTGLLATMIGTANAIFSTSWEKKQQVANATSTEELALITWVDTTASGAL